MPKTAAALDPGRSGKDSSPRKVRMPPDAKVLEELGFGDAMRILEKAGGLDDPRATLSRLCREVEGKAHK